MNETYDFEGKKSGYLIPSLVVAAIFFLLAFIVAPGWAVFATIPLSIAMVSLFYGVPANQVVITDIGIENRKSNAIIPFTEISGVWCDGVNVINHQNYSGGKQVVVEHAAGVIELQDRDLAKVASFTQCLVKFVKSGYGESLKAPFVNDYWLQERQSFGDNLIKVCRQAPASITRRRNWDVSGPLGLIAFSMAVVLWILVAILMQDKMGQPHKFVVGAAATLAVLYCIIAVISFIVFMANNKKYSGTLSSAIVISPRGFALAQKDLDGSITWKEVKRVKKTRFGLVVTIAGANIVILDIYDLPLTYIQQAMNANLS